MHTNTLYISILYPEFFIPTYSLRLDGKITYLSSYKESISWAPIVCTQLEKICWFVFFSDLNIRSKAKLKFFIVSLAFNGWAISPALQVKILDHVLSIWKMNFEGNIKLILHSLKHKDILSTFHPYGVTQLPKYLGTSFAHSVQWWARTPGITDPCHPLVILASKGSLKGYLA